jgi:hypothetical protein
LIVTARCHWPPLVGRSESNGVCPPAFAAAPLVPPMKAPSAVIATLANPINGKTTNAAALIAC